MKKKVIVELEVDSNTDEQSLDAIIRRRIDQLIIGAEVVQIDIYDAE